MPLSCKLYNRIASNLKYICFIHQIYWRRRYCSRHPACRNRHVKVPEVPWKAGDGGPRPGWRSGTPSIQPLTPETSYMTSRSRSDLMGCWEHLADLQHIAGWVFLQTERVLFKYAIQVRSSTVCSGTKCTFQNIKEVTTNCPLLCHWWQLTS